MAKKLLGKEVNEALVAALQTRTAALRDKGITHQYRVRNGDHSWDYWRSGLRDGLIYMYQVQRF